MTKGIFLVLICLLVLPHIAFAGWIRITASRVNVRSRPGVQHKIVTTVKKGDLLPAIGSSKQWWKVRLEDQREGWVFKKAARFVKETFHARAQEIARKILGDYLRWAAVNDVYLEEYKTARLDVMVSPEWLKLSRREQRQRMITLALEFIRLCREDPLLKKHDSEKSYVAFFDRFNTLLGKANAKDVVLAKPFEKRSGKPPATTEK